MSFKSVQKGQCNDSVVFVFDTVVVRVSGVRVVGR